MLMQPLRPNRGRQQTASSVWLPAPVRGWNAKNDLSDMEARDAIVLRNFIVTEKGVTTRPGHTEFANIDGDPAILTLMDYEGPDGTRALFAATATDIYDVSAGGDISSADVSSLTSGIWQHTMFATSGGSFLYIANGEDAPRYYDGSSWTTPTITGVTPANLITVTAHQNRLWFAEKNTLKIWYLGAGAVAGAATSINFGPFSRLGGYLVGMATWTRDGGAGLDDIAVFLTSEGECHVYSGTDPASASTWSRVGTFQIPKPIGRKCFIKSGSDVGVITAQGLVPLSNVLPVAQSAVQRVAATERIGDAFQDAYYGSKDVRGWMVTEWPSMALAVVNVPRTSGVRYDQFAYSTTEGAWAEWRDLDAECWCLYRDNLLFGTPSGDVMQMTPVLTSDNGSEINTRLVQAFNEFGSPDRKRLARIRPNLTGPEGYRAFVGIRRDYSEQELLFSAQSSATSGPLWNETAWNEAFWATSDVTTAEWQDAAGTGYSFALVVQTAAAERITYNGSTLLMERGGLL
jgi:hypothetical protein